MSTETKGIRTHARITASERGTRPETGVDVRPGGSARSRNAGRTIGGTGSAASSAVDGGGPGGGRRTALRVPRAMLMTGLTVLATACAARGGEGNPAIVPGLDDRIEIRIINNNFSDARMYAVHPRGREYIGMLTGKTEANYTLDWDFSQRLAIEISLLAGGTCTTEELIVDPGEALFLSIDSTLATMTDCRQTGTGIGGG